MLEVSQTLFQNCAELYILAWKQRDEWKRSRTHRDKSTELQTSDLNGDGKDAVGKDSLFNKGCWQSLHLWKMKPDAHFPFSPESIPNGQRP